MSFRMLRRTPVVLCLVILAPLGACGDSDEKAPGAQSTSADASVSVNVIDFGYEMPDVVEGPMIDLTITNAGEFAHELGLEQVEPGTTADEIRSTPESGEDPSWYLSNPAGISLLTAGQTVRYRRELDPGTYAFVCHFPMADGSNHLEAGMVRVFEVTEADRGEAPTEDATITVTDKGIELPKLTAGTQTIRFINSGTQMHELGISGLPPDTANSDLGALGQKIGQWFGKGQPGPPPGGLVGPGGHQTIEPGQSVWLTLTLEKDFLYRFDDSSGKKSLEAFVTIR